MARSLARRSMPSGISRQDKRLPGDGQSAPECLRGRRGFAIAGAGQLKNLFADGR
ncbi:MAG: hypothetical protein JF586_10335 [Burkholderiales bacterium]|nr:hypothetical protein [Burkholderiales bacterium]